MDVFISEVMYKGDDEFVEVVVNDGVDVSGYQVVVYDNNGAVAGTYGLGSVDATLGDKQGYVIDSSDGLVDIGSNWAVALVDDQGNIVQFIGFKDPVTAIEGPAAGETSTQTGDLGSDELSVATSDQGQTYQAQTPNPGTIPCYAPGTGIRTPDGERAVEDLRRGDYVDTLDHGPVRVVWTKQRQVTIGASMHDDCPVLIAPGALGAGRPARALVVSPQHRILTGGHGQLRGLSDFERLLPAKALTDLPGIRRETGISQFVWVHFVCARHEIVWANGCLSESMLLGPMVVGCLPAMQRRALAASLPDQCDSRYMNGPPVRPLMNAGAARRLVRSWRDVAAMR